MLLFVSSTYIDLLEERQAVHQALEAPGNHAIGGMEYFYSDPRETLDVCLDWVSRAQALIVIVGSKAGTVVPGSDVTYTLAEVEAAAGRGIKVFGFFKTTNGTWRNEEVEPTRRDLLDRLKSRVEVLAGTPSYFDTPDKLALRVHQSITAWDSLGRPGGRQVFASRDEFFLLDSPPTKYFKHTSPLRGRETHEAALTEFLEQPDFSCGFLEARGGQGKTKLLHDWTNAHVAAWTVYFLRSRATWHSEVSREVPSKGDVLFILDDAHREPDLFDRLLVLVNGLRATGGRRFKVIAAYRPSGDAALTATATRRTGAESIHRLPELRPLNPRELKAIAQDILPVDLAHYAGRLAALAGDSPLVVSVGAHMLAAGDVVANLTDDGRFKHEVLERFYFDYTSAAPVAAQRPLLDLLASVGPVAAESEWFAEKASAFLRVQRHEVLRGSQVLEAHGLLSRTRNGLRVRPDVLAEHLFRSASVTPGGVSTGYVDALYDTFGRSPVFGNLLTNASELGWSLHQSGTNFNPTRAIWDGLREAVRTSGEYARPELLRAVANAAFYQPGEALALVESIIDTATGDDNVTRILSGIAYDPKLTERAVGHLWRLAEFETRRENSNPGHAGRVLKELAEFGVNKHVDLNARMLDIATVRAEASSAYSMSFTPLDIADAILAKHIEHQESDDDAIYLSSLALNYAAVGPVRQSALELVRATLWSDAEAAQARAVQSIRSVLAFDLAGFGRLPSAEEDGWQDAERIQVIEMVEARALGGDVPTPFLYCLRRALTEVQGPPRSAPPARARKALTRLPRPQDLAVFTAVCVASWDDWKKPGQFERRMRQAAAAFTKQSPDPTVRVAQFQSMVIAADAYGVLQDTGASAFCEQLCHDRQFLDTLVYQVIDCEVSCLLPYLGVAMRELRCSDVAACRLLLERALEHSNETVRGSALHGIAFGKRVPTQPDIEMLAQGYRDQSHRVRRTVIDGFRFAARQAPELAAVAVDWLTRVSPNRDRGSAEWWCGALAPHVQELSAAQVTRVLAELEHIDVLDDYHVGELLQGLVSKHPGAVATLMVKRLDVFRKMVVEESYGYRPVPTFMRHKLHMAASSAVELLKVLRDAIPASAARMKQELTGMFWALGGPSSEALSLVDEWLHSEELDVVRASLDILAEAPYRLCLDRPAFAGHVVEVCRRLGEGDLALRTVVNNCTPSVWSRTIGSAPTEHSEVILEARRLAELWSGTFVGEALAHVALDIEKRSEAIRNEDAF